MKINGFRGDLIDISARKEALVQLKESHILGNVVSNILWSFSKVGLEHPVLTELALREYLSAMRGPNAAMLSHSSVAVVLLAASKSLKRGEQAFVTRADLATIISFLRDRATSMDNMTVSSSMSAVAWLGHEVNMDCRAHLAALFELLIQEPEKGSTYRASLSTMSGWNLTLVMQSLACTQAVSGKLVAKVSCSQTSEHKNHLHTNLIFGNCL